MRGVGDRNALIRCAPATSRPARSHRALAQLAGRPRHRAGSDRQPRPVQWPLLARRSGDMHGERPADDRTAVLMFGTPSGIVLSPQDPTLSGAAATDLPVREGYVLSGLDPAFTTPGAALPALHGRVEAIAVAEQATGPMRQVERAPALAGRGLDGDRYAAKTGTFTPADDTARGYDLTLIAAEILDELVLPSGGNIEYAVARRNIVTRGST